VRIRYSVEAKQELRDSDRFYQSKQKGLGKEFRSEVRAGIERIKEQPSAWQSIGPGIRRYLIRRFPFGIVIQSGWKDALHSGDSASEERAILLGGSDSPE